MHCDYKLLELLALRMNYVFPRAQQFACYNAFLPLDAIAGNSSSRLGNHAEKKLGCRERIEWICTHGGCEIAPEQWEDYCSAPLDFLIQRDGMVARLLENGTLAFKFFLGSPDSPQFKIFIANLGDALRRDLEFIGFQDDGSIEKAQLAASIRLAEMLVEQDDEPSLLHTASVLLGYLLSWMLGGSSGLELGGQLSTKLGGRAITPQEDSGGLVLTICEGSLHKVLGTARIDPAECEVAGIGRELREGSYETNVKVPDGPVFTEMRSFFTLPAPAVELTGGATPTAASPVSRAHAAFSYEGGAWKLYDLGSKNGTVLRRQADDGSYAWIIVGMGKRNEDACPPALFGGDARVVYLKNIPNAVALGPGLGVAVENGDDICLGFEILGVEGVPRIVPLEGAVILHVVADA